MPNEKKEAILTAGMSGVGKTELSQTLKTENNLLHIDTDEIREYFSAVGYNGQNSEVFQKPASKGFSKLFDYALKKGLSIILDSNLSNFDKAVENIQRLLNKNYLVTILYLYDKPEKCLIYTKKREIITKRKVPYNIFVKSNLDSYETVIKLKTKFKDDIILNFIDKRNNTVILYKNINICKLKKVIGVNFDNN